MDTGDTGETNLRRDSQCPQCGEVHSARPTCAQIRERQTTAPSIVDRGCAAEPRPLLVFRGNSGMKRRIRGCAQVYPVRDNAGRRGSRYCDEREDAESRGCSPDHDEADRAITLQRLTTIP
jgi:hypothetical protein